MVTRKGSVNRITELKGEFASPAAAYRGLPLGGFDYGKPEESAAKLKKAGWGGIQLHYPHWNEKYLQEPSGWDLFKEAVKSCRESGLEVWIYDECHYPSGKAGHLVVKDNPEFEPVGLFYDSMDISTNKAKEIEWKLPDGTPFYVAMCWVHLDGTIDADNAVDLTASVKDGTLRTEVKDGTWRLMAFMRDNLYEGTHAVTTGGKYVNIMDPSAVRKFLEVTHERYYSHCPDDFGKTITAFFTDEPSLMSGYLTNDLQPHPALAWWDGLPELFTKRTGYDIRQALPALFNQTGQGTVRKRCDYYSTVAEAVADSYCGQIQDWCKKHNVASTGHLLWEESLIYHANFYGSIMPSLARMDWPGIDVLGCNFGCTSGARTEGGPVTPKLISSTAHINNIERTATESFCFVKGDTPPEELCAHIAWQWVLGINTLSTLSVQQSQSEENLQKVNDYAGRLSLMLTRGKFTADVAVLYPIASVWADFVPTNRQVSYVNDNPKAKDVDDAWQQASKELLACQRDFDYVDESDIEKARVTRAGLGIGNCRYKILVLPNVTTLRYSTLKQIAKFVQSGGTVISYGTVPQNREDAGSIDEFRSLVDDLWDRHDRVIHVGKLSSLGGALQKSGSPDLEISPRTRDIYYQHRVLPDGDIYFLLNNSEEPVSGDFRFRVSGKAEVWDPANGDTKPVKTKNDKGYSALPLQIPGRSGVFVVFGKN